MTLQDICVSLELAKELEKNGYPQGLGVSNFYWVDKYGDNQWQLLPESEIRMSFKYFIAAPTSAEIGERLPTYLDEKETQRLVITPHAFADTWHVGYVYEDGELNDDDNFVVVFGDEKSSNAYAECWLCLKKQGLLAPRQPEEVGELNGIKFKTSLAVRPGEILIAKEPAPKEIKKLEIVYPQSGIPYPASVYDINELKEKFNEVIDALNTRGKGKE